jgi:hypothetical protein
MIISVDTKHDSHEDIRKVIAMLQHLVGEKELLTNAPQASEQQSTEMFAHLFSDAAPSQQPAPEIVQPAEKNVEDLFSDLLGDAPEAGQTPDEEQEDEAPEKPKIEFY